MCTVQSDRQAMEYQSVVFCKYSWHCMQHNVHIIISPVIKFNSKCHDIKSVETNFKYVISNVLIYLSENCLGLYKVIIILRYLPYINAKSEV